MNTRKQELLEELAEIQAVEKVEADKKRKDELVTFLDNIDVFLKFVDHNRTSCSDQEINNAYTTRGRGGNFRCNRCGLLVAKAQWKRSRDWLIDQDDPKVIERELSFYFNGVDVYISTDSED